MLANLIQYNSCISHILQKYFKNLFLLFVRVAVSIPFFNSGMLKLNNWDSTLFLFQEVYKVPLLDAEVAAYLATTAELVLPVIIILGLFSQAGALALFAVNAVAVISYPTLWEGGFYDHKMWALMLFCTILFGAGKWSLDSWLGKKE